jgi:hypothetical protein
MTDRTNARRLTVSAVLALFSLIPAANALAQPRWGRPATPRSGACFYRDANFEGDYFCVRAGEDIPDMPRGLNDEISSIRTFGDVEVVVFQDGRFRGRSEAFDRSVRNLRNEGWNDRLSSARVREGRDGGGNRGSERERGNSGGTRQDPDAIVRRAYQDILNREPDSAGLRLYRGRIIDDSWSESQVRDALRNSPEFRELNTMTRAKAEAIVARAYRSVLNREPDPGSAPYVEHVLREKWTEQDVAAELRKSAEYRNRKR